MVIVALTTEIKFLCLHFMHPNVLERGVSVFSINAQYLPFHTLAQSKACM